MNLKKLPCITSSVVVCYIRK